MTVRRDPSRPKRAALFDLDGLLIDSEKLYTQATQAVLDDFGKTFSFSVKQQMMGRAAIESARILVNAYELPVTPEAYLERRTRILRTLFPSVPALPGAASLIAELQRRNLPVAVATSSARDFFEMKTAHHPFIRSIATVVCGDDPEIRALKPAPDIFLVAARRLGVAAEDCVVFEDSPAGVTAGKAASMTVVAVPAPEIGRGPVATADHVLPSLEATPVEALFGPR